MMLLALKLFLTPIFIGSVTLAGRRWGPSVSGLLMGLPLTSAPISIILASQYGLQFAAHAAVGNLCGQASGCIFCLVYSLAARKWNWPLSALMAGLAFGFATLLWNQFSWQLLPAFGLLMLSIWLVVRLIPRYARPAGGMTSPKWDLPARMSLATLFVLLLTTFANHLGPQLSGLIAPYPVYGTVLAAFTHHQQGAQAAASLLRGVVAGSTAFAIFFLVVGGLLPVLAAGWTYTLASVAALAVNGVALYVSRS